MPEISLKGVVKFIKGIVHPYYMEVKRGKKEKIIIAAPATKDKIIQTTLNFFEYIIDLIVQVEKEK